MAGFSRAELLTFDGATLPDLLGEHTQLLFAGINPGLWTAAAQAHFARRGNRFYPALRKAGLIEIDIDASSGYRPEDVKHLLDRGIGITNLVARATARADELLPAELTAGAARLAQLVERIAPAVVAVLGITAYRSAFADRRALSGPQPARLGGAALWVVPNPSGLNAHDTVDTLAAAYRRVGIAAGVVSGQAVMPDGAHRSARRPT